MFGSSGKEGTPFDSSSLPVISIFREQAGINKSHESTTTKDGGLFPSPLHSAEAIRTTRNGGGSEISEIRRAINEASSLDRPRFGESIEETDVTTLSQSRAARFPHIQKPQARRRIKRPASILRFRSA